MTLPSIVFTGLCTLALCVCLGDGLTRFAHPGLHSLLAGNTNFPQWYPFDERDTEMLSRFVLRYNQQADTV